MTPLGALTVSSSANDVDGVPCSNRPVPGPDHDRVDEEHQAVDQVFLEEAFQELATSHDM